MESLVNALKFHPVSETHGFAIERHRTEFRIVYVERQVKDGVAQYVKQAVSRSMGRDHVYPSLFMAEYVIHNDILPLYGQVVDAIKKTFAPLVGLKIVE